MGILLSFMHSALGTKTFSRLGRRGQGAWAKYDREHSRGLTIKRKGPISLI